VSTTTIRVQAELKKRLAAAASRAGKSPHAFIVEAIEQTVEQSELDDEFERLAEARWDQFLEDGKAVPWKDARAWLLARARGEPARRPVPRRIKR
jgi:predicted transcriptional regulator